MALWERVMDTQSWGTLKTAPEQHIYGVLVFLPI